MTIKRTLIALVCAALAAGTPSSPAANPEETNPDAVALDPDYAAGRQALERKDWGEAAKRLGRAVLRDPDNADLHNDLGFAHRKLGQLDGVWVTDPEALVSPGRCGSFATDTARAARPVPCAGPACRRRWRGACGTRRGELGAAGACARAGRGRCRRPRGR